MEELELFGKKFFVLGDSIGYVKLISYMPSELSFEEMIVKSARVSYDQELKGYEKDLKLLEYLWNNSHLTPFESCELQFEIKCPLMVGEQITRYRWSNQNWQSRRYSEVEEIEEFYFPLDWRLQSIKNKQGSDGNVENPLNFEMDKLLYNHVQNGYGLYKLAISKGIAREQARLFLSAYSLYNRGFFKINLRNLIHFLEERCSSHAQWEIQQYANVILNDILPILCPNVAKWTKIRLEEQNS